MEPIHLLFTLDANYLSRLAVVLTSISVNNPDEPFVIHLMHRGLDDVALAPLARQCSQLGFVLSPIEVDERLFADAQVSKQYPQEMYYRMLAAEFLPQRLARVLYLDPDILVINSLRPLWETALDGKIFAAAAHSGKTDLVSSVNRVRLKTESDYFNTGVLLIDLAAARRRIDPQAVFDYTNAHAGSLILPDQDVLNHLFGSDVLPLEDLRWNYDARDFKSYYLITGGLADQDWVMANTAILHFCGKAKPWKKGYRYRFGVLYKHYEQLARRAGFLPVKDA